MLYELDRVKRICYQGFYKLRFGFLQLCQSHPVTAGVFLKNGNIFFSKHDAKYVMSLGFRRWCALGVRMREFEQDGGATRHH